VSISNVVVGLNRALQQVLHEGFELPVYYTIISANGLMIFVCCDEEEDERYLRAELITRHAPEERAILPLNVLLVDSHGKAAHFAMGEIDNPELTILN
jgi:hypothetical protein